MARGAKGPSPREMDEMVKGLLEGGGDVVLPEGVTRLPDTRGLDLSRLRSLTLPKTVEMVHPDSFAGWETLERVTAMGHLHVRDGAFANCAGLRTVETADGVSVDRKAFENCRSLESIYLRGLGLMRNVGEAAFYGCASLKEARMGDSGITRIEEGAFQGCASLRTLELPDTLEILGIRAFSGCTALREVALPETLRMAEPGCFGGNPRVRYQRFPTGNAGSVQRAGLLSESGPPRTLAQIALANSPGAWMTQMERVIQAHPSLAQPTVHEIIPMLSGKRMPSARTWESAALFVSEWSEHLDDATLQAFLDLCERRGSASLHDLLRDRCIKARFPARFPETTTEDPALRLAHEDWIFSRETAAVRSRMHTGAQFSDGSGACHPDALARVMTGWEAEVPHQSEDMDFSADADPTADRIMGLLKKKAVSMIAGPACRALGKHRGAVAAWCRYATECELRVEEGARLRRQEPYMKEYYDRCKALNPELQEGVAQAGWERVHAADADGVRAVVMREWGFDPDGTRVFHFEAKEIMVRLDEDLRLQIFSDGRPVKSVPRVGVITHEEREQVMNWTRHVRRYLPPAILRHGVRLEHEMLDRTPKNPRHFEKFDLGDPIFHQVARRLVWLQDDRTFMVDAHGLTGPHGEEVRLSDSSIYLAHPCEMRTEDVRAWKARFDSLGIRQPFRQLDDTAFQPADVEPDRYEGVSVTPDGVEQVTLFSRYYRKTLRGRYSEVDTPGLVAYYQGDRVPESALRGHARPIRMDRVYAKDEARKLNHHLAVLDRMAAYGLMEEDDPKAAKFVSSFSRDELDEIISEAAEDELAQCASALTQQRGQLFDGVDPLGQLKL